METKTENMITDAEIKESVALIENIEAEVGKIIVGQKKLIDRMMLALMCEGHILLEGVPGLAKTTAVAALAAALDIDFKRIQLTPDLLPSDIIGSRVYHQHTGEFSVHKGPVFTNFVLADEINRAPAKVQSALLEAMQERQVTIGDKTFPLPKPFLVMATQNPIEQEGTYPLPEAQVDRFLFKTNVVYPTYEEELEIMNSAQKSHHDLAIKPVANAKVITALRENTKKVYVDKSIYEYIASLVRATREPAAILGEKSATLFAFGASPRASIGLLKASQAVALTTGRNYVTPEDVKEIALDVLRHRVVPTYEAEAENVTQDDLVNLVLEHVPVP